MLLDLSIVIEELCHSFICSFMVMVDVIEKFLSFVKSLKKCGLTHFQIYKNYNKDIFLILE